VTQYEAVRLFIERARAVRADFAVTAANAPQIAEICHRLDGLPLAIELAAARSKLFAPQAILARLDRRLAMLTGGAQNLPARQQTLRGTIDWSYDLLDAAERESFSRLGVFVGGCTLAAAEAVLAAGGDILVEPLAMLASLLDKSLLKQIEGPQGEPRFSMLETIREYALERLEQSGEGEAIRRAHAMYYQALGTAEYNQAYNLGTSVGWGTIAHRLHREYDNLRSALVWSQTASGDADVSLHLALALSPVLILRGTFHEAIAALERSLNQSPGVGSSLVHFQSRMDLAELFTATGHYASAQVHYDHALPLVRDLGDTKQYANVLERLGWLAREQGDSATAWPLMSESLAISRELGNPQGIAGTLISMAEIAIVDEDPARAEALLAESRALLDDNDDNYDDNMIGWRLNHLGHAAQLRGDYAQATQLHLESLTHFGESFHFGRLAAYRDLGFAALGQEDLVEAARRLAQGLTLGQTVGDRTALTWCLAGLGSAAALGGQPERAARLWGAAERLRQSIGCRPAPASRATYERAMSIAHAALGDDVYAAAWAAGRALSLDAAVAEALAAG
jgi:tetratricopeptide (TPR) repeat protein